MQVNNEPISPDRDYIIWRRNYIFVYLYWNSVVCSSLISWKKTQQFTYCYFLKFTKYGDSKFSLFDHWLNNSTSSQQCGKGFLEFLYLPSMFFIFDSDWRKSDMFNRTWSVLNSIISLAFFIYFFQERFIITALISVLFFCLKFPKVPNCYELFALLLP